MYDVLGTFNRGVVQFKDWTTMYVIMICKRVTWTYQVKCLFPCKLHAAFTWRRKLQSVESCRYDFYHTWKQKRNKCSSCGSPAVISEIQNARHKRKLSHTRWGWRALSGRRSCPARPWWERDARRTDPEWPSVCDNGSLFLWGSWAATCELSRLLSFLGQICLDQDVCCFSSGRTRGSPWCLGYWSSSGPALCWPDAASSCGWWLRLP